jgi:hypothetical protein
LDDYSTSYIDVYNIVPSGSFYRTTEFEVIDNPDVEGNRYAVGDDDEMKESLRRSNYEYFFVKKFNVLN